MPIRLPSLLLSLVLAATTGCARYPADPEHTTDRVGGGVMRVGVIHDPPFTSLRDAPQPRGNEVRMVRALAQSLDARVEWSEGGEDELLDELQHFRLDLVIGGVSPQSPWRKRVALTLPYRVRDAHGRQVQRVTAVPPGENHWQMVVERFQRSAAARAILQDANAMHAPHAPATEPAR